MIAFSSKASAAISDPPIVTNGTAGPSIFGNGNTFPQTYDVLGRFVFLNLTMKF